MADNSCDFTGNLVRDPELRFTTGGKGVASFTLAVNRRYQQNNEWVDGPVVFVECSAWDTLGENASASLAKGDRVYVHGRLETREYDDKEGIKRKVWQIVCDEIAPSLKFATAELSRTTRSNSGGGTSQPQQQRETQQSAPQQQSASGPELIYGDEEPF